MRVSFGRYVFDSDTRELTRDGESVALTPKAFRLLELLISDRPRALSKQELHDGLWPGAFASDASLSNLVAELRSALGDDAQRPRCVRTVRRFGYAFVGDARPADMVARITCRLIWETREIELSRGETVLGRDDRAQVWIDDASVSRRHARIVLDGEGATLEDLGSKNGTLHNGAPLALPARLADGDQIDVGRAHFVYRESSPTRSTQTARSKRNGTPARSRTDRPR